MDEWPFECRRGDKSRQEKTPTAPLPISVDWWLDEERLKPTSCFNCRAVPLWIFYALHELKLAATFDEVSFGDAGFVIDEGDNNDGREVAEFCGDVEVSAAKTS